MIVGSQQGRMNQMSRLNPEKLHINYSPCVKPEVLVITRRLSGPVRRLRRL